MNIFLITDNFYPNKGGIAHTLKCFCKKFREKEHKLYIVNPYFKSINIFNVLRFKNYKTVDILKYFRNKDKLFIFLFLMLII